MGAAIQDYSQTSVAQNIRVLSPQFEDDVIPVEYLFREFSQMPAIETKALSLCSGRVLDVGSGAGSHSLYLQHQGIEVVSLDVSQLATQTQKERGVVNVECADFFNFESNARFDTLLLLMNGIGLAGTVEQLPTFLSKAKRLLLPGGQIILDSSDLIYLFEDDVGEAMVNLADGYYGQMRYQMAYKEHLTDVFPWLFIDFPSLREIAEMEGWCCELIQQGEHYDYLARLTE